MDGNVYWHGCCSIFTGSYGKERQKLPRFQMFLICGLLSVSCDLSKNHSRSAGQTEDSSILGQRLVRDVWEGRDRLLNFSSDTAVAIIYEMYVGGDEVRAPYGGPSKTYWQGIRKALQGYTYSYLFQSKDAYLKSAHLDPGLDDDFVHFFSHHPGEGSRLATYRFYLNLKGDHHSFIRDLFPLIEERPGDYFKIAGPKSLGTRADGLVYYTKTSGDELLDLEARLKALVTASSNAFSPTTPAMTEELLPGLSKAFNPAKDSFGKLQSKIMFRALLLREEDSFTGFKKALIQEYMANKIDPMKPWEKIYCP